MIISSLYRSREHNFRNGSRLLRCTLTYPVITSSLNTRSINSINREIFACAVSVKELGRQINDGNMGEEMKKADMISLDMQCTCSEGIFISFLGEVIISSEKEILGTFFIPRTFRISSAKRISLDMLIKPPGDISALCGRLKELYPSLFRNARTEDIYRALSPWDFCLYPSSLALVFPPKSIIPAMSRPLLLTAEYRRIRDIMKYEL